MRIQAIATLIGAVLALTAPASRAGTVNGTVQIGGVVLDETGDRSAVQETYDIEDGFALSRIYLNGMPNPGSAFVLDLRDLNLRSRRGDFVYRMPGMFKLTAGYDQNRHVFDPGRGVTSERKDFRLGAQLTPNRWLGLSGQFGLLQREGDRLAFPAGTTSALGTSYDNRLTTGQVTADIHKGRRGGGVTYQMSSYKDDLADAAERTGRVVSARFYMPCRFYDKWTHFVRGSYGVREMSNQDIDYTTTAFQYTGIVEPVTTFQLKYGFDGRRIDHETTGLRTDRYANDLDATYTYPQGRLSAGYGYETNDDDRTLTSYHSWRAGASYRFEKYATAKIDYAGRVKKDVEELTLLKDVEASQLRAKLQLQPSDQLSFGGGYTRRERELPDIGVEVEGAVVSAFGRFTQAGWGNVSADYSFTTDEYQDLVAGFETRSHILTSRVEVARVPNLLLAGGVTYLDIGKDLDIEKSILFVEGRYRLPGGYHVEVLYNVYNYDDYILLDRYYTANVVRFNLGYDLHL